MTAVFHCGSVFYVVFKHFHVNLIDPFGENQCLFSKHCLRLNKFHCQEHAFSEQLPVIQ